MKILKAAICYKCELPETNTLRNILNKATFNELTGHVINGAGFIPNHLSKQVVTNIGSNILSITLRYDERVIPNSVIKTEVNKRVIEIENKENRLVKRKEKASIKEFIIFEVIDKALIKTTEIISYYLREEKLLVINTTSNKLANVIVNRLLKEIGSIKAETIYLNAAKQGLTTKLKGFLNDTYRFKDFNVGSTVKLKSIENNAAAFNTDDITDAKEGILEAIESGGKVVEIELYNEMMCFRITADYRIKGIKFIDYETEVEAESPFEQWIYEAETQLEMFKLTNQKLLKLFEYQEPENELA